MPNSINIVEQLDIEDQFLSNKNAINQLIEDYKKYGKLIIAYDFDDTVKPSLPNYSCNQVIELLQVCSGLSVFNMVCFTCRYKKEDLNEVVEYLDKLHIRHDCINENHPDCQIETSRKIFFNVFLDNRAGLKSAYEILVGFLDWYRGENEL